MARIGAILVCLLGAGFGLASGRVTTSSMTMGKATVTSSSSSSSSSSASGASGKPPPQPSITRLVQEYPIPNGQAVKTTQIISGEGISGITETVQITRAKKKKRFSSTSTTQIGNAPPVTTETSSSKDGSRVKFTVGQGKDKFKLKALPPLDLDVKGFFKMDLFKSSTPDKPLKNPLELNAEIDFVTKLVDDVFKTTYFVADKEFDKRKQDAKNTFTEASNRFKELGLKYPDFTIAY